MYGWRTRLGLMITSTNTVNASEFYSNLPDGVSLQVSRMVKDGETKQDELDSLTEEIDRCAAALSDAEVGVIAFGCTSGSFLEGPGYEVEIERKIEAVADVPAVATAASIKRAFDHLDVQSLAVTSTYIPEINRRLETFLQDSGFEVVDISGLGSEYGHDKIPPKVPYREATKLDYSEADGIFISCTNYRTFEVVEKIEADTGKPVVTSNQATLWDALRTADIDYRPVNLGTLFEDDARHRS